MAAPVCSGWVTDPFLTPCNRTYSYGMLPPAHGAAPAPASLTVGHALDGRHDSGAGRRTGSRAVRGSAAAGPPVRVASSSEVVSNGSSASTVASGCFVDIVKKLNAAHRAPDRYIPRIARIQYVSQTRTWSVRPAEKRCGRAKQGDPRPWNTSTVSRAKYRLCCNAGMEAGAASAL